MSESGREEKSNLLITGIPGVGKTTVLKRVVEEISSKTIRGFLTEEIRSQGKRVGFRLVSFQGEERILAHKDFSSSCRVGRYGVDVEGLKVAVESFLSFKGDESIFVVDEIGKMECFSPLFAKAMTEILDSNQPVVATVALKGKGFIAKVKRREDADLWGVTRENRNEMPRRILEWLD